MTNIVVGQLNKILLTRWHSVEFCFIQPHIYNSFIEIIIIFYTSEIIPIQQAVTSACDFLGAYKYFSKNCETTLLMLLFSCLVSSDSFVISWTVAHRTPLSMGFPRHEYWSASPSQGSWTYISWTAGEFFTTEPPGKPVKLH